MAQQEEFGSLQLRLQSISTSQAAPSNVIDAKFYYLNARLW